MAFWLPCLHSLAWSTVPSTRSRKEAKDEEQLWAAYSRPGRWRPVCTSTREPRGVQDHHMGWHPAPKGNSKPYRLCFDCPSCSGAGTPTLPRVKYETFSEIRTPKQPQFGNYFWYWRHLRLHLGPSCCQAPWHRAQFTRLEVERSSYRKRRRLAIAEFLGCPVLAPLLPLKWPGLGTRPAGEIPSLRLTCHVLTTCVCVCARVQGHIVAEPATSGQASGTGRGRCQGRCRSGLRESHHVLSRLLEAAP